MERDTAGRIATTSGRVFRAERNCLSDNAVHWKIVLDADIDRKRMQEALDAALVSCPYMGMAMEEEGGRLYYTELPERPKICEAIPERLGGPELGHHLFCLACAGQTLELVAHHGLTDGAGLSWFLDALLCAYYGDPQASYQGVGTADYALDPLDAVSADVAPDTVRPPVEDDLFTLPNPGGGIVAKHLISIPDDQLAAFRTRHNCSTTTAFVTLMALALERAYPENDRAFYLRCPINSRRMLGLPHTFQNASLPQAFARVDATAARDGRIDDIASGVGAQLADQARPEHVAYLTKQFADALKGKTQGGKGVFADVLKAPVVVSNLGSFVPACAEGHVLASETSANAAPLMLQVSKVSGRNFLTLTQTYEDPSVASQLKRVLSENGIEATDCAIPPLTEGQEAAEETRQQRLEAAPRFMDRMSKVIRDYPDRTALVDDERSLTYAQLDEESGKVYGYLKRHGISKESFVQIVMPRCVGFFSCVGGVLRAGAAFVPLEDTYPPERIDFIRKDAHCQLVLDQDLYERIIRDEDYQAGYEATCVHDACFAVYTSGSTGTPKGVLQEYGALDLRALAAPERDNYPICRYAMMEHFYFVVTMMFESTNLLSATTIYIVKREVVGNLHLLVDYIERHQIERIFMTPSYARALNKPNPCLKEIIVAGEPANGLFFPGGKPRLHNMYAMSETAMFVCDMVLDKAYDVAPVGPPTLDLIDLHLEDESGERVEGPGQGEICMRLPYFRGYINLPEKTAQAIRDGIFHTGDLARRDDQGRYYIQGRKDEMFKINGNRIEPAEIEHRVQEVTGLRKVVAKGFRDGSRAYVCCYFLEQEAEDLGIFDGGQLTCDMGALSRHLPDYMIPAHYVALAEFPTNANGKIAKLELPEPVFDAGGEYVEPATERERLFCDLMAHALGLERVGATDDFYEIGGDSMGTVVFLAACADEGIDLPLPALYRHRTPRSLAETYPEGEGATDEVLARAREALLHPQPVLSGQREHVAQLKDNPDSTMFNLPQLFELQAGCDLDRLAKATDKVFLAHPALLTTFQEIDGACWQVYDKDLFEPTSILTLTDADFCELKAHLVRPHAGFGHTPHRRAIYHTDSSDYLFFDFHHSICDGTSLGLIRDQVYACYVNPDYEIPEDAYYYHLGEMAAEEADDQSPSYVEARGYYHTRYEVEGDIAACPCILKPDLDGKAAHQTTTIVGHREQKRTADGGSSLFLAATALAVAELNQETSALVYTAYHGRDSQHKRQSVGMYAVEIPVYVNLGRTSTTKEVMASVNDQLNFGMSHCTYPFSRLHPTPVPNTVLFNYQKDTMGLGPLAAIVKRRVPLPMGQNGMIVCGLIDRREVDSLTWYCGYSKEWYSDERMEAFHQTFQQKIARLRSELNA